MAVTRHDSNTTAAAAPTSSKNAIPAAKILDTQSVLKRLLCELMALMMSGETGVSKEDNILTWKGTISGIKETVFEGPEYKPYQHQSQSNPDDLGESHHLSRFMCLWKDSTITWQDILVIRQTTSMKP